MSEAVERSAAALFGAVSGDAVAVRAAAEALMADKRRWEVLRGAVATEQEKQELLDGAPALEGQEELRAFLKVLLEEGRLDALPAIMAEFSRLDLAAEGGVACVMRCARQPDEATQNAVRQAACGAPAVPN